ncbi:cache domain-containing sensor histidine kinase [Anaerotalea alkaliphila]|uniref:Sensor histidine kinase n=1 Tax=Anaerotalea alkaliphila TaxID=2662126 RepID=A0A7X5HV54_9FIRM|nr:sensor histidine kinase [Anaerotalea alkaliphila]NDL67031.1 sensor histidine kinase [Anaerotalea alkaliphila]
MKGSIGRINEWFHRNGIFLKAFGVTFSSVVLVAVLITVSTLRLSIDYFMETFTITNERIVNQSKERFEYYSNVVLDTIYSTENNVRIKRAIIEEQASSVLHASAFYDVVNELEQIHARLQPESADLVLMGENGALYNMNYAYWPVSSGYLQGLDFTKQLSLNPGMIQYASIGPDEAGGERVIVAGKAFKERSSERIYAYIYIVIRESDIRRFYEGYTSEENIMLLMNRNGEILSSNRTDWIGDEDAAAAAIFGGEAGTSGNVPAATVKGQPYQLLYEYIPVLDIYLVNLVDRMSIASQLVNMQELVLIVAWIVLIATILSWLTTRHITLPLTRLVQQIDTLTRHHFKKPLKEEGGYESVQIARAFNNTLEELNQYIQVVVASQKKQKEAELQALQHQINPHFLYNTLTTVKFMVDKGDADKAIETIHALTGLLQNTLGDISETVTVEKELSYTRDYVLINQARYGDRIQVNYFIDEQCRNCLVPKLFLQPMIENAFFHGFNRKKAGYIQIMVYRTQQQLICEVADDGDGMDMEKGWTQHAQEGRKGLLKGIGIRNVQERIALMYGDGYGVAFDSAPGRGTKVKVTLPLLEAEPKQFQPEKT